MKNKLYITCSYECTERVKGHDSLEYDSINENLSLSDIRKIKSEISKRHSSYGYCKVEIVNVIKLSE